MIEFFINLVIFVFAFIFVSVFLVFTFLGWKISIKEDGFLNSLVVLPLLILIFFVNTITWIVLAIIQFFYSVIFGFYGVILSKSFKSFKPYFMKAWKGSSAF